VCATAAAAPAPDGSLDHPLRVMLIPADGGTASGTQADFAPLFNAVTRATGIRFDLRVGESYAAVIEAMKSGLIEIAWFGPVAYVQARDAGAAELLAVAVLNGNSSYYSGIFVRADSPLRTIEDLKGRRLAVGDLNSGSSFTYPMHMLLHAGLEPVRDLAEIRITGSHSAGLSALSEGHVDAACLSFESFTKAVQQGSTKAADFRVIARSDPIPNPPLALSTSLSPQMKATLRHAFENVHHMPGISPEMVRGYGGVRVDRYDTQFPDAAFDTVRETFNQVNDGLRAAVLRKASQR
jgi:phosphonate transport system substrate-binding protein